MKGYNSYIKAFDCINIFGQKRITFHTDTPNTPTERYQSTHNERDTETNYDHREARNSDSDWGRFLGVDALAGDYPANSPYMYVGGNPVRYNDTEGDVCVPCALAIGWAVVEAASAAYDAYDAYTTVRSPNASTAEKVTSVVGLGVDIILPGGGYGKGIKTVIGAVDDAKDGAKAAKGGVYVLKDKDGQIQRSGRTKDLERRKKEHEKGKDTKDLHFEKKHETDDYAVQRGLEQKLHDDHKPPMNKIEPINPKKDEYKKAAENYLNNQPE